METNCFFKFNLLRQYELAKHYIKTFTVQQPTVTDKEYFFLQYTRYNQKNFECLKKYNTEPKVKN